MAEATDQHLQGWTSTLNKMDWVCSNTLETGSMLLKPRLPCRKLSCHVFIPRWLSTARLAAALETAWKQDEEQCDLQEVSRGG